MYIYILQNNGASERKIIGLPLNCFITNTTQQIWGSAHRNFDYHSFTRGINESNTYNKNSNTLANTCLHFIIYLGPRNDALVTVLLWLHISSFFFTLVRELDRLLKILKLNYRIQPDEIVHLNNATNNPAKCPNDIL